MRRRKTPRLFYLSLLFFIASLLILALASRYERAADFLNEKIGTPIRLALARLSGVASFSVAEIIVMLSPLLFGVTIYAGVRSIKRGRAKQFILGLLTLVMLFSSLYTATLGIAYHTSPIAYRMGFRTVRVTEDDLYLNATLLIDELNEISPLIEYNEYSSVMPYSKEELSEKISLAYDAFLEDYPIFKSDGTLAKRVYLGDVMASAGLLGMYTYFTGEANVSFSYPDYLIPETVAHEFAHQRGIAREDEAGFIAYLVCSYSEDAYIRYSGALGITEYLISAVAKTDRKKASSLYGMMGEGVLLDVNAYSNFYKKYENSALRKIARSVNDFYLKSNGTSGVVSYSGVVTHYISYRHSLDSDR